jgi:steroid 5-alpha reductase family enzyme
VAQARDLVWILIAYLCALCSALICIHWLEGMSPLWQAAGADVIATLVIFAFSRTFDNSSFYDAYWSVAPPFLWLFWAISYDQFDARILALGGLITLWAVRLTFNWARGWQGLLHQDWRYVDLRAKSGAAYVLVDLFGIHLMPTVLVFVGCLPLWLILTSSSTPWHWLDWLWLCLGFLAVALEARADSVLHKFRRDPKNRGQVLRSDVWSWCRHPNYLGELGFWLSLGLAGFAVGERWLSGLGFVLMAVLFLFISIPMIDKRQLANKPEYERYTMQVGSVFPRLISKE